MSFALKKLFELEKEATEFGFEWPNAHDIIKQAINECQEVQQSLNNNESPKRVQEELGDLLQASISLCRFLGFNFEDTISRLNSKFGTRLALLKKLTKEQNLDSLHGQSTEYMLKLWDEVKKLEKTI